MPAFKKIYHISLLFNIFYNNLLFGTPKCDRPFSFPQVANKIKIAGLHDRGILAMIFDHSILIVLFLLCSFYLHGKMCGQG